MISIITPTNRKDGLELLQKSLKRQTYKEYEWIISSPLDLKISGVKNTLVLKDPTKTTPFWPLNRVYNRLVANTSGELIVSYQDFIEIPPNTLEKLWYHYQNDKKGVVSGVGDIYKSLNPDIKVWEDPRKQAQEYYGKGFHRCDWQEIEFNLCAFPKQAWDDIGGADEYLDNIGYDPVNINAADRMQMAGYNFYLDQSLEVKGLKHEEHPDNWDENLTTINGLYNNRRKIYLDNGYKL